jgi:hypothetical protein
VEKLDCHHVLKCPWRTCANHLPESSSAKLHAAACSSSLLCTFSSPHVKSPQSSGLVGVHEGPLNQLADASTTAYRDGHRSAADSHRLPPALPAFPPTSAVRGPVQRCRIAP